MNYKVGRLSMEISEVMLQDISDKVFDTFARLREVDALTANDKKLEIIDSMWEEKLRAYVYLASKINLSSLIKLFIVDSAISDDSEWIRKSKFAIILAIKKFWYTESWFKNEVNKVDFDETARFAKKLRRALRRKDAFNQYFEELIKPVYVDYSSFVKKISRYIRLVNMGEAICFLQLPAGIDKKLAKFYLREAEKDFDNALAIWGSDNYFELDKRLNETLTDYYYDAKKAESGVREFISEVHEDVNVETDNLQSMLVFGASLSLIYKKFCEKPNYWNPDSPAKMILNKYGIDASEVENKYSGYADSFEYALKLSNERGIYGPERFLKNFKDWGEFLDKITFPHAVKIEDRVKALSKTARHLYYSTLRTD